MKNTLTLATIIVFLLCAAAVAQLPEGFAPVGPSSGTVENNVYVNDYLGFSFPIPEGWQVNNNAETKSTPGGGLILLIVDQHTGRSFRNRILIAALNAAGLDMTAEGFVSKVVRAQLNQKGWELVRDTYPVDLAGRRFFREDYKESSAEVTVYKALVSTKFRGYFLAWTLVAGSPEELGSFVKSLERISFREDRQLPSGVITGVIGSKVPSAPGHPLRVRVSQGVSQALLLKRVDPEYPSDARRDHVQGSVVLRVTIDTGGNVANLTLVSGDPLLAPAALEGVKQWKYKPYLLNGKPAEVETQVTVAFQLSGR